MCKQIKGFRYSMTNPTICALMELRYVSTQIICLSVEVSLPSRRHGLVQLMIFDAGYPLEGDMAFRENAEPTTGKPNLKPRRLSLRERSCDGQQHGERLGEHPEMLVGAVSPIHPARSLAASAPGRHRANRVNVALLKRGGRPHPTHLGRWCPCPTPLDGGLRVSKPTIPRLIESEWRELAEEPEGHPLPALCISDRLQSRTIGYRQVGSSLRAADCMTTLKLGRALVIAEERQADAQAAVGSLERFINRWDDYEKTEEYDAELDSLKWRLEILFSAMIALLDVADLRIVADDFLKHAVSLRENLRRYEHSPYDPNDIGSPALFYCSRTLDVVKDLISEEAPESEQKRIILQRIIRNTPNLLFDRGIEPNNEAEVRSGIFDILKAAFPDMRREVPMPKPTKTYKMDMGSRDLAVGIEYKFATSESALKSEIGGVYEDMKGYDGDNNFRVFHSVFCCTGPFINESRVLAEYDLVSAKNWIPHVLHVIGGNLTPKPARPAKRTPKTEKLNAAS